MTIALMQPYLFPYIGYFQLVNVVDKFVLLDDVNYINKGWINRNVIKDGKFTIALEGASQNKEIRELMIVPGSLNDFIYRVKHNYGKSERFQEVIQLIDRRPLHNVAQYVHSSLIVICHYLGVKTEIIPTSSIFGKNGKGQDRIIDICHQLGADRYINPSGGKDLYDFDKFRNNGIELKFINCGMSYQISIIDALFTKSIDDIKHYLNFYFLDNGCETKIN